LTSKTPAALAIVVPAFFAGATIAAADMSRSGPECESVPAGASQTRRRGAAPGKARPEPPRMEQGTSRGARDQPAADVRRAGRIAPTVEPPRPARCRSTSQVPDNPSTAEPGRRSQTLERREDHDQENQ
jgi:hypothetical protein